MRPSSSRCCSPSALASSRGRRGRPCADRRRGLRSDGGSRWQVEPGVAPALSLVGGGARSALVTAARLDAGRGAVRACRRFGRRGAVCRTAGVAGQRRRRVAGSRRRAGSYASSCATVTKAICARRIARALARCILACATRTLRSARPHAETARPVRRRWGRVCHAGRVSLNNKCGRMATNCGLLVIERHAGASKRHDANAMIPVQFPQRRCP